MCCEKFLRLNKRLRSIKTVSEIRTEIKLMKRNRYCIGLPSKPGRQLENHFTSKHHNDGLSEESSVDVLYSAQAEKFSKVKNVKKLVLCRKRT